MRQKVRLGLVLSVAALALSACTITSNKNAEVVLTAAPGADIVMHHSTTVTLWDVWTTCGEVAACWSAITLAGDQFKGFYTNGVRAAFTVPGATNFGQNAGNSDPTGNLVSPECYAIQLHVLSFHSWTIYPQPGNGCLNK